MDTNPEAPCSELEETVGAIAGTLYSKAWLLDMLVQLVKALEKPDSQDEDADDELDNTLVKLWDVSTEQPVACFLAENKVFDILIPACLNANPQTANRWVEISLGVLANTVSIPDTGLIEEILENEAYQQAVLGLFSRFQTDADVLIQCCRLLLACFHCDPDKFHQWEDCLFSFKLIDENDSTEFFLPEMLVFVLRNSKSEQLLLDVAKLFELLCGAVGRFLSDFAASSIFVGAVVEAATELHWSPHSETVCRLINVLYMVSTVDEFRTEFGRLMTTEREDVVSKLVAITLKQMPCDETLEVQDISCALSSSLSLLLTLLSLGNVANFPILFQNQDLWGAVAKVYKLLAKLRFSHDEEQSPAAVLKLNLLEFVASIQSTPDVNVEQYVLNKIIC